jgi:hypothetical protein
MEVFTDHKNLMRDALGSTSDWVYQLRFYIKGIHNTVADAISQLEYATS